nr:serine/arginine repetitive matrix protein 1-like [Aegilops tauschii subsp. strangulata]
MHSKAVPSRRERHRRAATARSKDQSFPRSHMTGNDSRDDAFKKGTIFAAAGPSEDRTCFHLGQHSPPPNATPRQPCRPHGHGDRAAPRHGLCPRAPHYHYQGRRPSIQDLDTTSPETRGTPTKETSEKSCCTVRETSSVLLHRARDELGPAAPGRETSGGPQLGEDQPIDGSNARATRRWGEGRNGPTADEPTPEKPAAAANRSVELPWSGHDTGRPSPRPSHAAAHGRSSGHARPLSNPRRLPEHSHQIRPARPHLHQHQPASDPDREEKEAEPWPEEKGSTGTRPLQPVVGSGPLPPPGVPPPEPRPPPGNSSRRLLSLAGAAARQGRAPSGPRCRSPSRPPRGSGPTGADPAISALPAAHPSAQPPPLLHRQAAPHQHGRPGRRRAAPRERRTPAKLSRLRREQQGRGLEGPAVADADRALPGGALRRRRGGEEPPLHPHRRRPTPPPTPPPPSLSPRPPRPRPTSPPARPTPRRRPSPRDPEGYEKSDVLVLLSRRRGETAKELGDLALFLAPLRHSAYGCSRSTCTTSSLSSPSSVAPTPLSSPPPTVICFFLSMEVCIFHSRQHGDSSADKMLIEVPKYCYCYCCFQYGCCCCFSVWLLLLLLNNAAAVASHYCSYFPTAAAAPVKTVAVIAS